MSTTADRIASHAWSRYVLQTTDWEYRGSNLSMVVDGHCAPRYTAGYLADFRDKVGDMRKVVCMSMYSQFETWGN